MCNLHKKLKMHNAMIVLLGAMNIKLCHGSTISTDYTGSTDSTDSNNSMYSHSLLQQYESRGYYMYMYHFGDVPSDILENNALIFTIDDINCSGSISFYYKLNENKILYTLHVSTGFNGTVKVLYNRTGISYTFTCENTYYDPNVGIFHGFIFFPEPEEHLRGVESMPEE